MGPGQDKGQSCQPQKRSTLLTVCPYILGIAISPLTVAMFEGACYTTPVIGALLADSCWGRYKTIMVFSCIYLLGIIVLTLSSVIPDAEEDAETADPLQYGVLLGALAIISLGTGGIKPNVSAFGADQFNEADPQDRKEKERFFNWFYLAINVGSLIACTLIVYIQ
ncbi:POT family-domain-containing protein, partial [Haematococcus lacustris]